ncbi:MAG: hypothetical protein JWO06_3074 [Bacteroidota bacterium]|nr:hypothetical protein [Bacteroidota bacterium]
MLSEELVKQYNKVRSHTDKSLLCHAPFVNINFEQNGHMRACCYNVDHVLGIYPQNSIADAWSGAKAEELRNYIRSNDLGGGCRACEELIESKNYNGSKSLHYDLYAPQSDNPIYKVLNALLPKKEPNGFSLPKTFEFELSNTCNLECEMCTGYFSSSIRKNREKLPPLPNPYDDAFVEQVAQFIPHLSEMKFLGGEPFLIDVYHKIWDKAIELNPNVRIHITTNGTVMNQRVRELIKKLNCSITVSIDALEPANYERIRAGAKYTRVMENINEFMKMAKEKNNLFSLAICPMTVNWHELPDFVTFANEKDIDTHYNTLWRPEHLSLRFMKPRELRKAILFLESKKFPATTWRQKLNVKRYNEVVLTLKYWLNEAVEASMKSIYIGCDEKNLLTYLPAEQIARDITLLTLKEQMDILGYDNYPNIEKILESEQKEFTDKDQSLEVSMQTLSERSPAKEFMLGYFTALTALQKIYYSQKIDAKQFEGKVAELKERVIALEAIHPSIIEGTVSGNPLKGVTQISGQPIELIVSSFIKGTPKANAKPIFMGTSFQPEHS